MEGSRKTKFAAERAPNQIQESILAQAAHQDINKTLPEKGLQMVQESQNPDLIVVTSNGLRQQTSWDAWGMRGIGAGVGGITPEQSVEGTMIVDLQDAKTQSLGRGIAQDTLSYKGSKDEQMVEKAVQKCSNSGQSIEVHSPPKAGKPE